MKEILEAIALNQGWPFDYGRSDFHNLFEEIEQKNLTHIFLDPVERTKKRNEFGEIETYVYYGNFMMLYSSDIDEKSYNERYTKYIKPIIDSQIEIIEEDLICNEEATIEEWKEVELINMFDYNFDGILITYRISIEA